MNFIMFIFIQWMFTCLRWWNVLCLFILLIDIILDSSVITMWCTLITNTIPRKMSVSLWVKKRIMSIMIISSETVFAHPLMRISNANNSIIWPMIPFRVAAIKQRRWKFHSTVPLWKSSERVLIITLKVMF